MSIIESLFYGIKVFEDARCVERIEVRRTWKERLFSLPWRPFQAIRTEEIPAIYEVRNPSQGLFAIGSSHFFVAHPQKVKELRDAYDNECLAKG